MLCACQADAEGKIGRASMELAVALCSFLTAVRSYLSDTYIPADKGPGGVSEGSLAESDLDPIP